MRVFTDNSLDRPVEDIVHLVALSNEQLTEEFSQIRIVRPVLKAQGASIVHVGGKLWWTTLAQGLHRCGDLLLTDFLVLLLLGGTLQSLPR